MGPFLFAGNKKVVGLEEEVAIIIKAKSYFDWVSSTQLFVYIIILVA